jgi:hypothetical protein
VCLVAAQHGGCGQDTCGGLELLLGLCWGRKLLLLLHRCLELLLLLLLDLLVPEEGHGGDCCVECVHKGVHVADGWHQAVRGALGQDVSEVKAHVQPVQPAVVHCKTLEVGGGRGRDRQGEETAGEGTAGEGGAVWLGGWFVGGGGRRV